MALVTQRIWRSGPRKVKRAAWGYTVQVACNPCPHRDAEGGVVHADGTRQDRCFREGWSKEDAEKALAARLLGVAPAPETQPAAVGMTFGQAVERYLTVKATKRSLEDDRKHLARLKAAFGNDTSLTEITAARIATYKVDRMRTTVKRDGDKRAITPATLNRELAALRNLLRLAVEEWEVLDRVPRVKLEKEPEGRIRWLEANEERTLLEACARSKNTNLAAIVTMAIETGMRSAEVMGLTWEQLDLSRGVIRLERTKSGRRREIPMRQAVYDLLAKMPEPRAGRVWPAESIRTAFENAMEAASIDDFTFHDLRHHFASWFVMRGGQLQALREILGHRDIKLTLRYAHLSPGHLRTEIDKTAAPINAQSTHGGTIDRAPAVSLQEAGVAQRQSN